jgi:hypothetical protein
MPDGRDELADFLTELKKFLDARQPCAPFISIAAMMMQRVAAGRMNQTEINHCREGGDPGRATFNFATNHPAIKQRPCMSVVTRFDVPMVTYGDGRLWRSVCKNAVARMPTA